MTQTILGCVRRHEESQNALAPARSKGARRMTISCVWHGSWVYLRRGAQGGLRSVCLLSMR